MKRPDGWAYRRIRQFRVSPLSSTATSALFPTSPPRPHHPRESQRSLETSTGTPSLDARAATLLSRLRPLLSLDGQERSRKVDELAAELGLSRRTIFRQLRQAREGGAAALNRRRRSDAGTVRVPPEVQQAFLSRRLNPVTAQEPIQVTIDRMRREFPKVEISDHSLRQLERSIPRALQMSESEWRARFAPTGQWEVPHPNHTQVFDMTLADVFVWDQNPNVRPYRPHLTAIVDEHTQSCLFALYTKETPSTAVLQAVLLHGWLPKPDPKWPQCGAPLHLHCDNGKVQDSNWLQAVCETLGADLNLCGDIRHAAVRSPWGQGHIERFFGIVHTHLECAYFSGAYCGRSPEERLEGFKGNGGRPADWAGYPTLASLNHGLCRWIADEYHHMHHRRLDMTRLEAWQHHARGHVRIPDRSYLETALLHREGTRLVRRSTVQVNTYTYWHSLLQGHEETPLEVRSDPADLTRLLVLGTDGQPLCWAKRQEKRFVDNPKNIAEHRREKRETKEMRRALRDTIDVVAATDEGTYQRHVRAVQEARERQVIPFPIGAKVEKPQPTPEPSADEILALVGESEEPDPGDADGKLEIHGIQI